MDGEKVMHKKEIGDEPTHDLGSERPHYVVINIGNCDLYNFLYATKSVEYLTAFCRHRSGGEDK